MTSGEPSRRLLDRPVVAIASVDDARTTARAVRTYLADAARVTVVHVVEKGGGAPDKASVEQREAVVGRAFEAFRAEFGDDSVVETRVAYDTGVANGLLRVAGDVDASAVVFVPRAGGRLARLVTGDVAARLFRRSDRPVVGFPRPDDDSDAGGADAENAADGA